MELVIHRKQVLPCPETCPLQIYNLLINCWSYSAMSRPTFSKIALIFDQIKRSQFQGPRKQVKNLNCIWVAFNLRFSTRLLRRRWQVRATLVRNATQTITTMICGVMCHGTRAQNIQLSCRAREAFRHRLRHMSRAGKPVQFGRVISLRPPRPLGKRFHNHDKNGCKITSFRYNIQITKICRLHWILSLPEKTETIQSA